MFGVDFQVIHLGVPCADLYISYAQAYRKREWQSADRKAADCIVKPIYTM